MLTEIEEILAHLEAMGIRTATHRHPAVHTVEESLRHNRHLPGLHVKNLFLKDRKDKLWLVTCRHELRVDVNRLAKELGAARFSFGRAELLQATLGVEPGSVTPLALVNDQGGLVQAVLDRAIVLADELNCHPLRNTASTVLRSADLLRFLASTGHPPLVVDLPEVAAGLA
jgi:Ala-tRNA(Pro) deacylase